MQQVRLYLVSAQVSLQNGLSQQAEALLRSALAAVAEALGTVRYPSVSSKWKPS